MRPPTLLSGLRSLALMLLGWSMVAGLGLAQSSDTLKRLDELLERLETPSSTELLATLGQAPALDELLLPLEEGFVPFGRRKTPAEFKQQYSEMKAEVDRLAFEDPGAATAIAAELAELQLEVMGADHPNVARSAWRALELEAMAELNAEDLEHLQAVRSGYDQAIRSFREGHLDAGLLELISTIDEEFLMMGDRASLSRSLSTLGVILHGAGDYPRAERAARAGLARALHELSPASPYVANGLNSLAWLSSQTDNSQEAASWHAHSLALRRRLYGDRGPEVTLALMHLVDFLHLNNDLERARLVCDRAIEILVELDEMPDRLGILLGQRGSIEWSAGEDDSAYQSLEQAIVLMREAHGGDHADLANALGLQADVVRNLGEHQRALELAESAAAMVDRIYPGPHPLKGQAHHRLASCLVATNELDRAEEEFLTALAFMESGGVAAHGELAKALDGLAALLAERGDTAGAEALSERIPTELRRAHGPSRQVANALRQLARRRHAIGETTAAIEAQSEALEIYVARLGEDHARVLQARSELARLLAANQSFKAAKELVAQVLDKAESDPAAYREPMGSANLLAGWIARSQGELEDAARFVDRALEVKSAYLMAPHPELIEALSLQGQVLEEQGQAALAAIAYEQALQQCDALRVRILGDERDRAIYAGELSLGALSRSLARVSAKLGESFDALEAAELGRERALLDLVERSSIDLIAAAQSLGDDKLRALRESLKLEEQAQSALHQAEVLLRREAERQETSANRVALLESKVRDAGLELLLRQGEREAWLRSVWPTARTLSAQAIAGVLGEDEALLHYTFDENGILLIALLGNSEESSQSFGITSSRERAGELREVLLQVCADIRGGQEVDPDQRRILSQALIPDSLWEALEERERVVIVPDGPLHELPFEVLSTPAGDWLERGPRITYSPSATLFARTRQDGRQESSRRALVLGAPDFGSAEEKVASRATRTDLEQARLFGTRLAPLPGSEVEAREVRQKLAAAGWEVDLLLGEHARVPRLYEEARGAGLVHLSTHGLAPSVSSPYDAALALTPPRSMTEDDDGFLTLEDLVENWGGRLSACDLVVLSACDTQVGVPLGESRVALSWGFFFAGAESVLVSLWRVDDRATALLMDRFYENYTGQFDEPRRVGRRSFEHGQAMPEDAALQEAKLWLSRSTPEANLERLRDLGFEEESAAARRDFPRPGAAPTARSLMDRFDFRAPRFGSAFSLYGQPD